MLSYTTLKRWASLQPALGSGHQYTSLKNKKGVQSSVQLERTDVYFICILLLIIYFIPFLNSVQILEILLF